LLLDFHYYSFIPIRNTKAEPLLRLNSHFNFLEKTLLVAVQAMDSSLLLSSWTANFKPQSIIV